MWICSISKAVPISIGRGENSGREVTYYNVVRNLLKIGDWNGSSGSWTVPLESISREGVDAAVVYVQDGNRDKPGAMLGGGLTRRCTENSRAIVIPEVLQHQSDVQARNPYSRSWFDSARSFQTRQYARPE